MTEDSHPIADLTDAAVQAILRRTIYIILILGAAGALVLWIASGWRNGAMLAVGAVISAASIFEWQRLIRLFTAKMDSGKTPRGTALVVIFFLLRLIVYAGLIYASLKCLQGSPVALLCGLGLAVLVLALQALRLLRS
jgi:hypothetical protein